MAGLSLTDSPIKIDLALGYIPASFCSCCGSKFSVGAKVGVNSLTCMRELLKFHRFNNISE
jgi:hypothetical protein